MTLKATYIPLLLLLLLVQCRNGTDTSSRTSGISRLETIRESGVLKVVTDYNSTNYFIYRGQPMGYQYELLQNLADYLQVRLEVIANNDLQQKFKMLKDGQVDLIAVNLTVTNERRKLVEFTEPHSQTRQVLVQRKPAIGRYNNNAELIENNFITNQLELAGKYVTVQSKSAYSHRLQNLSEEIGDTIHVVEKDEGIEQLVEMVAKGEIDYTVCDENVAMVNQTYYKNIDISLPISFPQNLAWAVDKGDKGLKEVIDTWLIDFKKTRKYAILYNKYFKNNKMSEMVDSDYYTLTTGNISPYDEYIKEYSSEINWDWRLVASMMYQESRFDADAKSWAGAFGLMQMMPTTATRFGIDTSSSPRNQIKAGIMFIQWLDKMFQDISDPIERQKFVLASYNVGPGHIIDARNLAKKNGKDPNIWTDNVDLCLLQKADPKFYNDPVVKYGYCRGTETYKYVAEVVERYEHYKNHVQ